MTEFQVGRDETTKMIRRTSTISSIDGPPETYTELVSAQVIDEIASAPRPKSPKPISPEVVARDAARHRSDLVTCLGNECGALALDTENDVKPENRLEQMLVHQLAVAHKAAMDSTSKAFLASEPADQIRYMNLSARMMEVYQRGTLTLQRLRTGGSQKITVHHVTVSDGGQAIVGNVQRGGKQ
jgi:hypothetical protein